MKGINKKPPRLAVWILQRIGNIGDKFSLFGDMEEEYSKIVRDISYKRARSWYWWQVFISLPPVLKNSIYWSVQMFKNYLKMAYRISKKNGVFSSINIFGLAIGIAAFLIIFNYVVFETSYDSFHENADNIYRIRNDRIYEDIHDKSAGCPPAVGPTLKKEFPEVLEFARLYGTAFMNNIVSSIPDGEGSPGSPEPVIFNQEKVFYADPSFLRIFSFSMVNGSEIALDEADTAVISESSALKYFGDQDPMGKIIAVTNDYGSDQLYKITGVFKDIPENSHVKFEFLLSYITLINLNKEAAYYWGWNAFNTYILLASDADPQDILAKLPQMVEKYKNYSQDYRREYVLQPLKQIHLHSHLRFEPEVNGDAKTVAFLIAVAIFILLIAWVNYINLSTARSMMRSKEVGVRKALGSQRFQLIKQFILESFLFNTLAVAIGVAIVAASLPFFSRLSGKPLAFSLWNHVWLWLVLSVIAGAFLSGIYPAFVLSSYDPIEALARKIRRSGKGVNLRKMLVIFQFSLSIVLIASTLIVYSQLAFIRGQDLGFDMEQTLIVKAPRIPRDFKDLAYRFKNELLLYPSIKNIAISSTVPGKEYSNASSGIRPLNSHPEDGKRCFFINVDDDYFDFYGIELAAGRNFSKEFGTEKDAVILNEEALRIFGYENPESSLNQKILLGGLGGQIKETIGVIENYHHKSMKSNLQPIIFSYTDRGSYIEGGNYFSLKIDGKNARLVIALIESKWKEVFPGQPFENFFLDEFFDIQYRADQRFGKVFGLFAILAIFVSCLGLFGLASFVSEQRTKEIGIRKVLGASVSGIVYLLSREFTIWVLIANIIAWPIAYTAMKNWLENFAYRITIGVWMFLLAGALALVVALMTVSYQAVKAAGADPVDSLRYE